MTTEHTEDTARRVLAEYEAAGRYLGDHRTAAPDLAREVLRLRAELERVKELCHVIASTALYEPRREDITNIARRAFDRSALAATEPDDERGDP